MGRLGTWGKSLSIFATKNRNKSLVNQFTPGIESEKEERDSKREKKKEPQRFMVKVNRKYTWKSLLNIKK